MADEDEPRSFVQSDLQISELEAHNENDRKYSYSSRSCGLQDIAINTNKLKGMYKLFCFFPY